MTEMFSITPCLTLIVEVSFAAPLSTCVCFVTRARNKGSESKRVTVGRAVESPASPRIKVEMLPAEKIR